MEIRTKLLRRFLLSAGTAFCFGVLAAALLLPGAPTETFPQPAAQTAAAPVSPERNAVEDRAARPPEEEAVVYAVRIEPEPTATPAPTAAPEDGAQKEEKKEAEKKKKSKKKDGVLLEVENLSQLPDYPTGCETVSAAMLCSFYGLSFDPDVFIKSYLPMQEAPHDEGGWWVGGDMWEAFLGDPRTDYGWGCYATALAPALSAYLEESGYRAEAVVGKELSEIVSETLDKGRPALLWGTIDMVQGAIRHVWTVRGTTETRSWVYPMHCMLLVGYDEDSYLFNDPLKGETVSYPKADVEAAYKIQRKQALLLRPID